MANFGDVGFGTLEPGGSTQEEQISFTGITQNSNGTATLTGVKTVLFISPYTQTAGLAKSHVGGATFVISNTAGFYDKLSAKSDDETITGLWQFPNGANTPILGTSYVAPTIQYQVASKGYVDAVAISGAPNASTSVQGLVQLPTQAQVDARTATGSTGAALSLIPTLQRSTLLSDYVVDTGAANAYVITPVPAVTAYATGDIFSFKAVNANTTTSTLNVNGLGVKTIKNSVGANLVANDILAGQIIVVEYDGTNFQILSTTGNGVLNLQTNQTIAAGTKIFTVMPQSSAVPSTGNDLVNKTYVDGLGYLSFTNGTTTKIASDASATQNIAHGLGRIPKKIRIVAGLAPVGTIIQVRSETVYNGTTQSSLSIGADLASTPPAVVSSSFMLNANPSVNLATNNSTGVVTFDSTNIIITWTKTGSPTGTYNLLWEAE